MKSVLLGIALGSVLMASNVVAAEQKIIFNVDSFKCKKNVYKEACQMMCEKSYTDERASDLIKQGWNIVTTSPKEYADKILGDTSCIGTQYVMQKDDPVPVAKPDVPSKAEELLKQEIDLLKREIALLKQENESLKAQIKPSKKKK